MGDPETEVVMPRLQTDLVALFAAMDNGTLVDTNIIFDERSCATVVAVSGGYPGDYKKNLPVKRIEGSAGRRLILFSMRALNCSMEKW
jgi:phosphoribosylamine--glycine ligase